MHVRRTEDLKGNSFPEIHAISTEAAILSRLRRAVVEGNAAEARTAALDAFKGGVPPYRAIMRGMNDGMKIVGRKFQRGQYFVSDLIMAAEAMNEGLEVLRPHLKPESTCFRGRITIGSVEGDVHNIGKNIVVAMLRSSGFEVLDVGVDVSPAKFVETVKAEKPQILAASAYMSTTIQELLKLNHALKSSKLRNDVKFLIGGAAVSPQHVEEIGADGYGRDAIDAVKAAGRLLRGTPR
jgi:trimethylamine corrinoid protein